MKKYFLFLFTFSFFASYADWMDDRIEKDISYFKTKEISWSKLNEFYIKKACDLSLVKYTILNNKVSVDKQNLKIKNPTERIKRFEDILNYLCKNMGLPNTTLLISITDGLNAKEEFPFFAMCKKDSDRIILIPDYESLGSRYQVLKYDGIDITNTEFPWKNKLPQMIWRGSTGQLFLKLKKENLHLFSRITLCKLSQEYPSLIDAKFTLYVQNADQIPELYNFQGEHVSFLDQMNYKFHILIDGNVSPYTKSGWKFFTNSLIFKPDSKWIQWYYDVLQPYVHYVPVKADLSDLVEKILWALENDEEAEKIARQCRNFALEHITFDEDIKYLYKAIMHYNALNFVP